MTFKKKFFSVFFLLFALLNNFAEANQSDLKPFDAGGYQKILENNANKPFLFIIWSITCSSCLKEMPLIGAINQKNPQLKIIMLATEIFLKATLMVELLFLKTNYFLREPIFIS